ncbi:MAG: bifunctional ADP-heptose synthase [Bacteroidota bacterium]
MHDLKKLLDDAAKLRILVVGDAMLDRYLYGRVDRVSPEAPVPVVDLQREEVRLGGAANVALNLQALGAKPYLCSVIGQDVMGAQFMQLMQSQGMYQSGIVQSTERQTTVKSRVIAQSQHLLRIDREQRNPLKAEEEEALLQTVRRLMDEATVDLLIFQDYNKGVLYKRLIETLLAEAQTRHIKTIVDPKFDHFFDYKKVDLFKPNLREVSQALGWQVAAEPDSLRRAAQSLRERLGQEQTLITLSEKGVFVENEAEAFIVPTQARNIADVCGAGDTVVSMAALGLGLGLNIRTIALLSNLAGGQVCEKVGVVSVDKNKLIAEYQIFKGQDGTSLP